MVLRRTAPDRFGPGRTPGETGAGPRRACWDAGRSTKGTSSSTTQVDRAPVRLGQIEEPPEERLVEDARPRVPLERDGDELGLVLALAQLVDELVREDLGAPANERAPAERRRRSSSARCFSSASSCATRSSRSSISRRAAALKERWSYATGSTYHRISLRSTAFAGVPSPPRTPGRSRSERSAETGQSRSASARAAWRSSPPPASPGAAPERRTSCFSCSKRAATSTSPFDEIPASSPFSAL